MPRQFLITWRARSISMTDDGQEPWLTKLLKRPNAVGLESNRETALSNAFS